MPTLESHNGYYLWHYIPSQVAAIVFICIFVLATCAHGWRLLSTRMWFCLPFFIGGIFEVVGYAGRAMAYDKTGELIPYILQSIFLLLAPILFAASLYMTFGRCVRAVDGDQFSAIRPRWTTRIFVFGDVFSFLIQGSGAGLMVKGSNPTMGQNIIVGGLIFQVIIFAVFIYVALHFNIRFRKHGMTERFSHVPWQACLNMLYGTSLAVMVRNIFRVVEYVMGQDGYLLTNEWPVYVFDGVLMFMTMAVFYYWYPSKLRGSPGRTSMTEMALPGSGHSGHSKH